MRKVDRCRTALQAMDDWEPYLLEESGLPGPRGNIELARAVAEDGVEEMFLHFLPFDADKA